MAHYHLLIVNQQKHLSTPAHDRSDALAIFGKELGVKLTLIDNGAPAPYLLDEWFSSPHWVNPTILVFRVSG
jgi:hypothetical protein